MLRRAFVHRIVLVSSALSACSTGVVQTEKDVYMLSHRSGACAFGSGGAQEADAYKDANAFCGTKNLRVETVSMEAKDGIPFARCASANLKFRCVP